MRYEVIMAVKMSSLFCWNVTLYGLVSRYQRVGETYVSIFRVQGV